MKKGITPIIAVIILLLITVALAGMAWAFLSGYFSGMTAKNIQLIDYSCAGGSAKIIYRNAGSQSIAYGACSAGGVGIVTTTCGDLTVTKTLGGDIVGTPTISPASNLGAGSTATFSDVCGAGNSCTYRLVTTTGAGGPSPNVANVNCP